MGTVSPWHVSEHFSECVRLKKFSQPVRIVRTPLFFKTIFVAVSMYWQSSFFFVLLEILHMNIIYAYT